MPWELIEAAGGRPCATLSGLELRLEQFLYSRSDRRRQRDLVEVSCDCGLRIECGGCETRSRGSRTSRGMEKTRGLWGHRRDQPCDYRRCVGPTISAKRAARVLSWVTHSRGVDRGTTCRPQPRSGPRVIASVGASRTRKKLRRTLPQCSRLKPRGSLVCASGLSIGSGLRGAQPSWRIVARHAAPVLNDIGANRFPRWGILRCPR